MVYCDTTDTNLAWHCHDCNTVLVPERVDPFGRRHASCLMLVTSCVSAHAHLSPQYFVQYQKALSKLKWEVI